MIASLVASANECTMSDSLAIKKSRNVTKGSYRFTFYGINVANVFSVQRIRRYKQM